MRLQLIPSFVDLLLLFSAHLIYSAQAQHYGVTGIKTGIDPQTGARPARRNILDMQNDIPTWSLYIQSLTAMQEVPEGDLLSWFQIAGIHGRPYISWDGIEWNPEAPQIGYCTHFNQILAGHAQKIAKQYNSQIYQTAADKFRIPYWDWALNPRMPDVVNAPNVVIETPSGQASVPNPLLLYSFQEFPLNSTWFPEGEGRLTTYPTTVRNPIDGVSNPDTVNANLGNAQLMQRTYAAFLGNNYNKMATSISQNTAFEYGHNKVHQAIGGFNPTNPGHMGTFSYAAFDPIFFLLHTNVDRLLAMWQAINPTEFIVPEKDNEGSFTNPVGAMVSASTPLTPFTMVDGETPYTSTSARYTSTFGYSYPEVPDWLPWTPAELAANVSTQVKALYNPGGTR
ncbi:Di-copper centre-containing protein [Cadophora sp. DSE1049]|nr:Di-copper centre-containing protein [Cadophora sp. DSE1049]